MVTRRRQAGSGEDDLTGDNLPIVAWLNWLAFEHRGVDVVLALTSFWAELGRHVRGNHGPRVGEIIGASFSSFQ